MFIIVSAIDRESAPEQVSTVRPQTCKITEIPSIDAMPPSQSVTFSSVSALPLQDVRSPNQQLMPLTATVNESDHLEIGGCDVKQLVEQFGSPLYILDEQTVRVACQQYRQSFEQYYPGESLVIYASKAWNCLAMCALIQSEGIGIDVVSGGELYTALSAGMSPEKIYLHGNNKAPEELALAIACGCTVIADNWYELELLVQLARQQKSGQLITNDDLPPDVTISDQPVRVMLRLTPGIECHTHEYIQTGHLDSKFGFDPGQMPEVLAFAQQHPEIQWMGIHAHIGSQIFEVDPHRDLTDVLIDWFVTASEMGLPMAEVNVGGGLGIRYVESDDPPSIADWSKVVCAGIVKACDQRNLPYPKLICEPGRSLVASACVTAYTVGAQKIVPETRTYLSVDGGMSDNPRPITYQSQYSLVLANRMSAPVTEVATIAGKHCESGDILIKDANIPACTVGDNLVILATGAYNYSMSSNYNRIPRPAAVLVHQGQANLILQRETYQDLLRQDRIPARLQSI